MYQQSDFRNGCTKYKIRKQIRIEKTTMIIIETELNVDFIQTPKKNTFPSAYALSKRQINYNICNILYGNTKFGLYV